jgi:hypothetical protein
MLLQISISESRASKSSNKCSFHRYLYSCNTVKCAHICSSQGLCELNYLFFSRTTFLANVALTLKPPPTRLIYCRPHNNMVVHTNKVIEHITSIHE